MRILWNYLGIILIISAFFRIPAVIVALIYKEPITSFIITSLLSIVLGFFLYYPSRKSKEQMTISTGLTLTALSFLIIPLISSITFLKIFNYNILNAYFEAISGFTTTGLSMITSSLAQIPKSILFWRAETQWMGGLGIVMVFLFILSRLRGHTYRTEEISDKGKDSNSLYLSAGFPKLEPSIKKTTFEILSIYGAYTLLGIIFLWIFGMPLLEAIGMTFTSISTGGFTMGDSLNTNHAQLVVLSLLMILGSISFVAHRDLIKLHFKKFFSNTELRIFLVVIILMFIVAYTQMRNFEVSIFQLISSFTTTGYTITEISLLPQLFIFFIIMSMVFGGAIGSTSGGMKLYRGFVLLKGVPWLIKKLSSPGEAIILFKMGKRVLEEKDLLITYVYIGCYLLILLLGTIIFMLFGYNFLDSSFQIVSALGTVGLSTMELRVINPLLKIILMLAMLLGRLEIFPLLVLIRQSFNAIKSRF
jgi:trk system potassium uptake protein TrkH